MFVPVNSAVILGSEPVIIDTGTALNRERWLDAFWSMVAPGDVRWVFLSHDDHDHVGNLEAVLAASPRATLVTTWFSVERLSGDPRLPLDRCRSVNDAEHVDAGDRRLVALRPPLFDAPTTRVLFDATSGFYWSVDSFGSLLPGHVADASELDEGFWEETFLHLNRLISPWHTLVGPVRFDQQLGRLEALAITSIGTAHGTGTSGAGISRGFALLRQAIGMAEARVPGQADPDAILAAALAATAPATEAA